MNGYAILGWGSLIWDLDNLAPHVRGGWAMGAGPRLAMEFTRVSPKRKRALVVCLDAVHGTGCATNIIASVRDEIGAAAADLARRERAPDDRIGTVCLVSGHARGSSPEIVGDVRRWCAAEGWAGAVWTGLPSNFEDHLGEAFSVPRAVAYLRTLTGDSLDEAVRYIEQAPAATDTPLRRALAADEWWCAEARQRGLR
ncbi:MAG: hypothetical protein ACE5EU_07805 [Paracoccaceae bacterium]